MEDISRFFRSLLSRKGRVEIKALIAIAWPVTLVLFFELAIISLPVIFCGHLEENVFSGVCLAVSYIETTTKAIGLGFGSALDTLVPQTFGADNKRRVGIVVQTSILIFGALCFPIWGLWLNTEYVTGFIAKDPRLAKVAGEFADIYMPALPAIYLFIILSKYMENQEIVKPLVISCVFSTVMSALYNAVLIYGYGLDYKGAAMAGVMGNYTLIFSTLGLIWWKGLHCDTWKGWSKECLLHWGLFYKLAVPGFLMFSVEWWTVQAGTMIVGVLGATVLNTQGIFYRIFSLSNVFSFAMSVAACTRVGIFLGEGRPEKAKFVAQLVVFVTFVCTVFIAIIFVASSSVIGYIFIDDALVRKLLGQLCLLYFGIIVYFDWLQFVLQGVFRGCGYQNAGALINNAAYILITIPVGISLCFKTTLSIFGLWLGMLGGTMFQLFAYLTIVSTMNWEKQSSLAKERASLKTQETEVESSRVSLKTIISRIMIYLFFICFFVAGLYWRLY